MRARRTRPPRPAGPATVESAVDDPIELSHPVPADATHLPPVDWSVHPADFGAGMPTGGLPELRDALSRFLTHRMNLPTPARTAAARSSPARPGPPCTR
ncbi:Uncharacterised protein [Mycobacteroides abscessus subsp. abscessus]|nr:Uncharacterised protein [Mycobacteroides abscessus subsp. abscessus]